MIIGGREFELNKHTYVCGILNVTPDSFSDGGQHNTVDSALFHAEKMLKEGADIIDIGGESTRPGYTVISDEEEIQRVFPVAERIKKELGAIVSIDTYKPKVFEALLEAKIDMLNDIWGLTCEGMAEVAAKSNLPVCIMHNSKTMMALDDKLEINMLKDMEAMIQNALLHGVKKENIIVDPGIGFSKDPATNLKIIATDNFMMPKDYPVLLGTSRKSVIGAILDLPSSERVEGTLATTQMAVNNRSLFVRVHDVKENVRFIKMAEALRDCK